MNNPGKQIKSQIDDLRDQLRALLILETKRINLREDWPLLSSRGSLSMLFPIFYDNVEKNLEEDLNPCWFS